jgi:nucleoside-diphosphate-sugar epimerase
VRRSAWTHAPDVLTRRRVLVTGASGFIGSHLVTRLLAEGAVVHVLLRPGASADRLGAVRHALRVHEGDVTYPPSVRTAVAKSKPHVVFHLAADTGVRRLSEGWAGVERSVEVNLRGTLTVLRAALESPTPVKRFVRAGGLEEYGSGPTPYVETQRERPISAYSASQVAATHYCEMLQRGSDTGIVTLRPALVYGPGQSADFLIPSLIASCLRGEDFDMTAGTQHRDLLYVDDLIDAFVLAATRDGLRSEVINVGHGVEHAIGDVADAIVRLTGSRSRIRFGAKPERGADLAHLVTTTTRAAEVLGWRARVPLEEGLRRTIEWHRAQSLAAPDAGTNRGPASDTDPTTSMLR